jgi:UPF0716 protein FxsA
VFLLVALFIVVPLVELYVIIQVGGAIGVLPTIAILLVDSILGSLLLRSQGRAAWQRFQAALAERRPPAREVFDGAMIIVGGTLLLTPGFITDIFGLVLLIPPTRALVRRALTAFARRRGAARVAFWGFGQYDRRRGERWSANGRASGSFGPGPTPGDRQPGGARPYDVEGSGHEVVDEPSRQLPDERENER